MDFARKTTLAAEAGLDDEVFACKVLNYEEQLTGVDLMLIAPQAVLYEKELREKAEKHGVQVHTLSEKDFSFTEPERTYTLIERYRREAMKVASGQKPKLHLWHTILLVLRDSVANCGIFILLAAISSLLVYGFGVPMEGPLQISGGILGLYFVLAIGYNFGKHMSISKLACSLVTFGSTMILLPSVVLQGSYDTAFFEIRSGYLPTRLFSVPMMPILVACALFAAVLFVRLHQSGLYTRLRRALGPQLSGNIAWGIPGMLTFLMFFGLNMLLRYLLSM